MASGDLRVKPAVPHPRPVRTPTILQLEAVECGAAALSMVLACFGRHVPLEQMRIDCGVTRDGSKAGGLLRAARAHGLVARGFRKEPADLASLPMPAILFVNFNHFVVLEGFRDGLAHLNDPARGRRRLTAAELDQAFTGVVLTFERGEGFEPGGHAPSALRSLLQYVQGFQGAAIVAFALGLLLVLPGLAIPWLLGRFVDDVLVKHLDGVALPLLAGLVLAAVVRSTLVGVQAWFLMETYGRAVRKAAGRFVRHALALPMAFYAQRSPGEIAARVDLNERAAEVIARDMAHLGLDLVTASFFLVMMVRLDPRLTLLVAAFVALELLAWRALAHRTEEVSQELSVQGGKLAGMSTGALANIETIKAGGQETALFRKWMGLHVRFLNATLRAQRTMLWLGHAPAVLSLLSHLAVLGVGSMLIMRGAFSVGDLVAYQVLLAGFTAPVHELFAATQKVQGLRGDLARLDDVLHHQADPEAREPVPGTPPLRLAGTLEFRDVTFGYGKGHPPLLEGFNLTVRPGGRVALVGASGSGKSTVARLAAGLHAPWSGEILLDGRPRTAYDRAQLAANVAYVDQDVALFEGSVRDNVSLWAPVPDEALHAALRDAALDEEIAAREGGLDAALQEGGRNLSGGQRQRLELARALAIAPALLILDEATSALDVASEARVEARLRERRVTTLVVAHRLSTVRDADEILVLDAGRIVERGTHAELVAKKGGRYAALVSADEEAQAA